MRSRTLDGQRIEVELASTILNTMTHLGLPDSYRVACVPLGGRGICSRSRAMQQRPRQESVRKDPLFRPE